MSNYTQVAPDIEMPAPTPISEERLPQYETPRYAKASTIRCRLCSQVMYNYFFRLNGQKICSSCAELSKSGESTASRGSLLGALVFGFGGALIGAVLYSGVLVFIGPRLGYMVMILGWIVGKAAISGADGVGGSRIQIASAALTYFAISLAALPASLYNAFLASGSVAGWGSLLLEIPHNLAAPVTSLQINSIQSVDDVRGQIYLLVGICVALGLTRVKHQTVAGPFDLSTA